MRFERGRMTNKGPEPDLYQRLKPLGLSQQEAHDPISNTNTNSQTRTRSVFEYHYAIFNPFYHLELDSRLTAPTNIHDLLNLIIVRFFRLRGGFCLLSGLCKRDCTSNCPRAISLQSQIVQLFMAAQTL